MTAVFHVQPSGNVIEMKMCRCGRAPHRPRQRNCHFCNAEAAKRYRRALKKLIDLGRNVTRLIEPGA